MKDVTKITPADFRAHPVWKFSDSDEPSETAVEPVKKLLFGRVETELPDRIVAEVRYGVYITVPRSQVQRLPNSQVDSAKHAMSHPPGTDKLVAEIAAMAAAMPVMVFGGALQAGLSGAKIMQALKSLGGTPVGGIIVLSSAPALLSAVALDKLCANLENDSITKKVVGAAGTTGAIAGTSIAVVAVSEAGTVVGLSASGITSGLAAIGGTMIGGVVVCAAIATGGVAVVGGLAWLVTNRMRQRELEGQYRQFLESWRGLGYTGPQ